MTIAARGTSYEDRIAASHRVRPRPSRRRAGSEPAGGHRVPVAASLASRVHGDARRDDRGDGQAAAIDASRDGFGEHVVGASTRSRSGAAIPNVQSFTRVFKAVYGMPPATYRRRGTHTHFRPDANERTRRMYDITITILQPMKAVTRRAHRTVPGDQSRLRPAVWLARRRSSCSVPAFGRSRSSTTT